MNNQNLYELFSDNKAETTIQNLKAKIAITLMQAIKERNWTQVVAAEKLKITQPRMSNLKQGKLEKFSLETLMQYLVRLGYNFDVSFNPINLQNPLSLNLTEDLCQRNPAPNAAAPMTVSEPTIILYP